MPQNPSLSTPVGNTGISIDPSKAARTALLVAKNTGRLGLDIGGNAGLKNAINSFSQQRNAQLTGSPESAQQEQMMLAALMNQPRELAVAEPPQQARQPVANQYGDLGDEIERGAKFLRGEPADDDNAPVAGQPTKEAVVNAATGRQSGNAPPVVSGVHVRGVQNGSAPPLISTQSFQSPQPFGPAQDALIDRTKYGIAGVESPGWKNPYAALGPVLKNGDRAYGKYQVMGSNIPAWTKEALGTALTPAQFYRDPEAQEKTASYQIGKILDANGGDPHQAASVWFTGRRLEDVNPNASDGYTTNREYQRRFANGFNSYPQPSESANAEAAPVQVQNLPASVPEPARGNYPSINPPPQEPPAAVPPPLPDASAGPQAQADPMSNTYDNPLDPNAAPAAARGGYMRRADGGSAYSSMPTNELIDRALRIIRRHRAGGGGIPAPKSIAQIQQQMQNADTRNAAVALGADLQNQMSSGIHYAGGESPEAAQYGLYRDQIGFLGAPSSPSTPTPQPTPDNTPAVKSGTVGNQGIPTGAGINDAPTSGPPSYDPANPSITGPTSPIPMASPTGFNGYNYNNTLDQTLGTNNPTMNQIFGFNYPQNLPAPKPQPQGPVSQNEINALYGFGGGSQMGTGTGMFGFNSGGAIIMDALNRARKASKGKR